MITSIGLAVNESKTKLLLSTAKDTSIMVSVEIDGHNFEVVKDLVYLVQRPGRCHLQMSKH